MTERKVHEQDPRLGMAHKTVCGRDVHKVITAYLGEQRTCKSCLSGGASNSPAQVAAKVRNFKIKRLRGMYATAQNVFDLETYAGRLHCRFVCDTIDKQLVALGAEPETDRRVRQVNELLGEEHDKDNR